jgi:hypothetical protein
VDIQDSEDPEGLRVFYYLVQDLRVRIILTSSSLLVHIRNQLIGPRSLTVLCFFLDLAAFQNQAYMMTTNPRIRVSMTCCSPVLLV